MAIGTDYSQPITVNGFSCSNCSQVALADRHIDPADPSSGPFGGNGSLPEKAALKNHFSPEARNRELLEAEHRKQAAQAAGSIAAAYGAGGAASMAPGQLVNLTG